jgi:hypothetical protein
VPLAPAYVGRKRWATRISCHGAPPTSACAAFIKESRMEFANANKVCRKSGGSPPNVFSSGPSLLRGRPSDHLDQVVEPEMSSEGGFDLAGVEFVVFFGRYDGLVQWQTDDGPAEQTLRYSLFA